jgi:hypothetical protein
MPKFSIAHIQEQGQNLIIIPLESNFRNRADGEQQSVLAEFERRSNSAGLKGHVVLVWDNGGGRMGFIAPSQWHPFVRSINLRYVAANINRELSW